MTTKQIAIVGANGKLSYDVTIEVVEANSPKGAYLWRAYCGGVLITSGKSFDRMHGVFQTAIEAATAALA